MTDEPRSCPTCERPIPEDAPDGVCPACAFLGAAETEGTGLTAKVHSGPRFEPPSLDEVRRAFPQLEIHELIGCGGMGAVYRARQPRLQREVALKILPSVLAENPDFIERFTREGQVLAKLSHPNIVNVYDFGTSTGGEFSFLLMEFVDGVNLRQAMRAGRFSPTEALGIVPRICEALQYAHDQGVLHRDIKPENLLIDAEGNVKIVDFGIAKLVDAGELSRETILTRTGVGMPGTPQYMAPEQIEKPAGVDHRADIYSLGVVFYELLTGELPLGRFAAPSAKAAVDARIDAIVMRTLEKEKELRQQSADELRTDVLGARKARTQPDASVSLAKRSRRVGILWLVSLLFLFGAVVEIQQIRRSEAHLQAMTASAASLRNQVRELERRGDAQSAQLVNARDQWAKTRELSDEVKRNALSRRGWQWLFVILSISFFLVMIGIAWHQLRQHRSRGLRKGHRWVLFPAMLPVVAVVGGALLALWIWIFQPAPDGVERLALVVGVIAIVAGAIWWIRRVKRWVKAGTPQVHMVAGGNEFVPERLGWALLFALIGVWLVPGTLRQGAPVIERVRATAYVESPETQINIESRFVEIAPSTPGGESPGVAVVETSDQGTVPKVRLPVPAGEEESSVLFPPGQVEANRRVFDMPVDSLWYLAFKRMREGEVAKNNRRLAEALEAYREAAQFFDVIEARDPETPPRLLDEQRAVLAERVQLIDELKRVDSTIVHTGPPALDADPSDRWFRAFLLLKEAQEADANEDRLTALNKYIESYAKLKGLKADHPDFHTEIVRYRLMASRERIAELRVLLQQDVEIFPAPLNEDEIDTTPKPLKEDPLEEEMLLLENREIPELTPNLKRDTQRKMKGEEPPRFPEVPTNPKSNP